MARERERNVAIGFLGVRLAARTRKDARIGVHIAKRIRIHRAHALDAFQRVGALIGKIQHQAGMQILVEIIPLGAGQLVDLRNAILEIVLAMPRPAGEQGRGQVRDRPLTRNRQMRAGLRELVRLQRFHAKRKPRDAVIFVDRGQPFGERDRFFDRTALQRDEEGQLDQIRIFGIGPQHRAVVS